MEGTAGRFGSAAPSKDGFAEARRRRSGLRFCNPLRKTRNVWRAEAKTIETLRDIARRDDPACLLARADIAAWERAEGFGLGAAVARTDIERWVPGLPARPTYKVLGVAVVAAIVVDSALDWLPPSEAIDTLDSLIRYGTAGLGAAAAGWSILSEVRGWEGSEAARWFRKARVKRYRRAHEARRRALRDTLIAIGATRLVVYREQGGRLSREAFASDAILGLSLEAGASHMALRLTTRDASRCFEWLPRDAAFEAAVERFAGARRASDEVAARSSA